jgi:hypothetical protein
MIASGLTGTFWAHVIFYDADIKNIQCRGDLKSPSIRIIWISTLCKQMSALWRGVLVICWEERRQDHKFNSRQFLKKYPPYTVDDVLWRPGLASYVLCVPGRKTFVSTNHVVFGIKCPMAKDSSNVIETRNLNDDIWCLIFRQRKTLLWRKISVWETLSHPSFVLRFDDGLKRMHISLLDSLTKICFFRKWMPLTQIHSSMLNQCVSQTPRSVWTCYADSMSRPDAKLWKDGFDKEMNGFAQRKVLSIVEQRWSASILQV